MTIYTGEISHKPSADHLAGQVRHLDGATDNATLALAFGVNGYAGITSNNGKISMIDLFPSSSNGTVYVDPNELSRIDDLDFIKQHLNLISNWAALVRYMTVVHHSEMQMALTDVSSLANFNSLTNEAQIMVAKYFFNVVTKDDVRQTLNEQTDDAKFHDEISRNLLGIQQSLNFELHGLSFSFGIKSVSLDLSARQVKVNFKIEYAKVNGSVRQIKGLNAAKQTVQFKFFKRKTMELVGKGTSDIKTTFIHNYDKNTWTTEIVSTLRDKVAADFDSIKHLIKNHLSSLTPHDANLDEFEEYNVATAVNRIWSELRFPLGEITTGNIDMESLKKCYQKEISINDFLRINQAAFIEKLQKSLASRFAPENVDFDAYINRAVEYARDDLRGVDITKIVRYAQNIAEQTIDEYANSFYQINDLDELIDIYHSSNRIHDTKIIQSISIKLINKVNNNDTSDPDLKAKVEQFFSNHLQTFVIERYQIFLQNNSILLNSSLDQNLVKKFLDNRWENLVITITNKAQRLNIGNLDDYLKQQIQEQKNVIDDYFKENFDYDTALNTARQNIFDNLSKTSPYSKIKSDFWVNILNNIQSYKEIQGYQYADNVEQFVAKFAPNFEDVLHQETTISWEEIEENIIEKKVEIYKQVIEEPFNKKISSELNIIKQIPNSIQSTLDDWYMELTDLVDSDIKQYKNSFKLYPTDTVSGVIEKFINNEKGIISNQIDNFNWDDLRTKLNELLDVEKEDLKSVKQSLINVFSTFVNKNGQTYPIIEHHFNKSLAEHQITKPIFSFKQDQKCESYLNQILNDIQTHFDADVCQKEDLTDLMNGNKSYEDVIRNYLIELNYNEIINNIINWNDLSEIAREEIIDDLIEDTHLNRENIFNYINTRYPNELINQVNESKYNQIVNELLDSEDDSESENIRAIAQKIMGDYEFIILENEWPTDIDSLFSLAEFYADKNDFISKNWDELKDNTFEDYQSYISENSTDIQQMLNDDYQLNLWLNNQGLTYLINKAGFENAIVVYSSDEIINQYI